MGYKDAFVVGQVPDFYPEAGIAYFYIISDLLTDVYCTQVTK